MERVAFFVSVVALVMRASVSLGGGTNVPQLATSELVDDLVSQRIVKARVLHVPYDVFIRYALTPENFEQAADFRKTEPLSLEARRELVVALRKAELRPLDHVPDLRWGAVFLDKNGREVHAIYLNGLIEHQVGREAVIDGTPTRVSGSLVAWFERTFPFERAR